VWFRVLATLHSSLLFAVTQAGMQRRNRDWLGRPISKVAK
jgi:hypothetical protein